MNTDRDQEKGVAHNSPPPSEHTEKEDGRSHSPSSLLKLDPVIDPLDRTKQKQTPTPDPFLVQWETDDPENPQNWSSSRRWFISFTGGLLVLNATFASSAISGALPDISKDLGISTEVAVLTLSLFLLGYVLGPMFWGPLSEVYGRRPMFLISFAFYLVWQIGSAVSPNATALLIFRFLGGAFAACPLTNTGALMADLWNDRERGRSMCIFTLAPFMGPSLGPITGGYLSVNGASWRWVCWIMVILAGICLACIYFFIPETYTPILLKRRAQQKRLQTGDSRYYAAIEKTSFSLRNIVVKVIARPMKMFVSEPMLTATTIYVSFNYGCLYLLFEAYPFIFTEGHHLNAGVSGLAFLPLTFGGLIATIAYLLYFEPQYIRKMDAAFPNRVEPEQRLWMAFWGGPIYVIGFFWLGWTSSPNISFWAPLWSGVPTGMAITFLFVALINYTVDVYLPVAASALAANTTIRSIFGVVFPLFAPKMFRALGPSWACTLLGCVSAMCAVIPFVLFRYGPWLRSKSKFTATI